MDQCCWTVFYLIRGHLKYKFGYQKCIYMAGLEMERPWKLYLMYGHGGHVEKWHFCIVGTQWVILSLIFFSCIQFREIRLINLTYHTWSHNHIWVSRWWFGISIFGTQMTIILDLVNKSLSNVAEMHCIGFVDPENISLDTKSIFLAGLEIKIS